MDKFLLTTPGLIITGIGCLAVLWLVGKLLGIVSHGQRAAVDHVPDAFLIRARFASSVDSRAAAGTIAQLFVTPAHGAAGVVQVVLQAVPTVLASHGSLAIEAGRSQQLVPQALTPGIGFAVGLQVSAEEASAPGTISDEVPMYLLGDPL